MKNCARVAAFVSLAVIAIVSLLAACAGEDPVATTPASDGGPVVVYVPGNEGGGGGHDDGSTTPPCTEPAQCTADGKSLSACGMTTACDLGCVVGSSHCRAIVPSGATALADTSGATAKVTLDGTITYVVDTETGAITKRDDAGVAIGTATRDPGDAGALIVNGIGYQRVEQDGGPPIAVFSFDTLTIAPETTLRVSGANAVAFVTHGDLTVDGTLAVRPDCTNNLAAPGGPAKTNSDGSSSASASISSPGNHAVCGGAGGGGNGALGGSGGEGKIVGSSTATGTRGVGGLGAKGTLLDALPLLVGGGWGGVAANTTSAPGVGAPGGGALHLVAGGRLVIRGIIDASGCGGRSGFVEANNCGGAGGGGAGGTILLEAVSAQVTATGHVVAHGGGGGGGTTTIAGGNENGATGDGNAGAPLGGKATNSLIGGVDSNCASGQNGDVASGGTAGDCSAKGISVAASGGGGAIGRLAVKTADQKLDSVIGAVVVPNATTGLATAK